MESSGGDRDDCFPRSLDFELGLDAAMAGTTRS
jgi:hypothetical protein